MKRSFERGGINITGDKELDKNLRLLGDKMQRTITRKAMRRFTAKIKKEAKRLSPKKTGKLKKSIENKVTLRSNGRLSGKVHISTKHGVHYGHFVEWGRQYPPMPGNRFMTAAFEKYNEKRLFADEVRDTLDEYLAKMVAKHR